MPLLLHFTWCACSILIPSNPSFCPNIAWNFILQSFRVSPFVSFIPLIHRLFRRNLSSNSVSLSLTYFGSIWYSYITWISICSFYLLFSMLSTFCYKLLCVNSSLFLRSFISFFKACIFCIISLKLPLIKLVLLPACFLNSSWNISFITVVIFSLVKVITVLLHRIRCAE